MVKILDILDEENKENSLIFFSAFFLIFSVREFFFTWKFDWTLLKENNGIWFVFKNLSFSFVYFRKE